MSRRFRWAFSIASGDKGRLGAVAACKILRSKDADRIAFFEAYQQNLVVIVSKILFSNEKSSTFVDTNSAGIDFRLNANTLKREK